MNCRLFRKGDAWRFEQPRISCAPLAGRLKTSEDGPPSFARPSAFPHRLTIPWGSRRDAFRLRARSRMEKASWMPRSSTLGTGSSSCLRRACAMKSAI